jgi:hypothetical protein
LEKFFASPARAASKPCLPKTSPPPASRTSSDSRRRAFRRRLAGLLRRQPALAHRHAHPVARCATVATPRRTTSTSWRSAAVATVVCCRRRRSGSMSRRQEPAQESGVHHAAHQGCDLRPLPRRCGKRPSVDTREPDVRMHGFITADECTLYIDTSGAPLYQRGLRQKTVEAPLKENVAAGILRLSGWQPGTPLLDPMCGSGTFLLEAAQMALNIAPGAGRSFGFQRLKNFARRLERAARRRWTLKNRSPGRRSTAATSRHKPCAPRWPTLTAPACCRCELSSTATSWKSKPRKTAAS